MKSKSHPPTPVPLRSDPVSRQALAKMIIKLFDHWKLGSADRLALLGLCSNSRSTLGRYEKGSPLANNRDILERVGHLLAIHKSLRIIFSHNRDLAYRWMTTRDRMLDHQTPVEFINKYGFMGLLTIRALLDKDRGQ